ncbi:ferric reductase-like transmembrane domain-containing protein [Falsihalocynthiibacter sp. SS001]|uniref:ferric reductase-like transmembrane domain-containing protein n=1 Tax=Falsihalocynthiibacter sp. SS001 TaxID=3349698 RepID=UPI0036D3ECC6
MPQRPTSLTRNLLVWATIIAAVFVPIITAAMSPLLAWRDPIYITGGFAGIIAMAFMLVQPLLARGQLPGFSVQRSRRIHRWTGLLLTLAVAVHVICLWITSPPDMIDALLFVSPTPFSTWGVIGMWAIFAAALVALLRKPLRLKWRTTRTFHIGLVLVAVTASVIHALQIEGTMLTAPKIMLCALVSFAVLRAVAGIIKAPNVRTQDADQH